jgi:hypothetical protein
MKVLNAGAANPTLELPGEELGVNRTQAALWGVANGVTSTLASCTEPEPGPPGRFKRGSSTAKREAAPSRGLTVFTQVIE